MSYARINEWFYRFIWSSLRLANVNSRWDGIAVSVPSKLPQKMLIIVFFLILFAYLAKMLYLCPRKG